MAGSPTRPRFSLARRFLDAFEKRGRRLTILALVWPLAELCADQDALAQANSVDIERIISFDSEIRISPDSSIIVTETISVIAQGRKIQRGIYRDFPTIRRDQSGNRYRVGFELLQAQRNGELETYKIENRISEKRIRIGKPNVFLDTGVHVFTLTYKTDRQIGYFQEFDELYWNVTGNDWDFDIESARATIYLPDGANFVQFDGYTGVKGAQDKNWRLVSETNTTMTLETTTDLKPGEGLTIAAAFTKGIVPQPTPVPYYQNLFSERPIAFAFCGLLIVCLYYGIVWFRFGRDPKGGVIFPRFKPPRGLSPGAVRFVWQMAYDRKCYTAAIVNLAVKGAISIQEDGKSYIFVKNLPDKLSLMSPGEKAIFRKLLQSRALIKLSKAENRAFSASVSSFRKKLHQEFEGRFFFENWKLFCFGVALTAGTILTSALLADGNGNDPIGFQALWLTIWSFGCSIFLALLFWIFRDIFLNPRDASIGSALLAIFLSLIVFTIELMAIAQIIGFYFLEYAGIVFLLAAINLGMYEWLKAPTLAGREVMDQIEGFRLYLSVAEQNRLNQLTPPKKTPELFERFLPYAIALDVENEWEQQFTSILSKNLSEQSKHHGSYKPSWYSGSSFQNADSLGFSAALSGSLGSSISSSASSGSGSSGGGGGGGGGGGW